MTLAIRDDSKVDLYEDLDKQAAGLFTGERNGMANAANLCALLFQSLPQLNWAGFYFLQDGQLTLGPFQGKVACVRIALGRGVCGTAAQRRETIVVPDVRQFPGHIACDAESRSEIVLPLVEHGRLHGVLDLDSPRQDRFDNHDATGLQRLVTRFLRASDLQRLTA